MKSSQDDDQVTGEKRWKAMAYICSGISLALCLYLFVMGIDRALPMFRPKIVWTGDWETFDPTVAWAFMTIIAGFVVYIAVSLGSLVAFIVVPTHYGREPERYLQPRFLLVTGLQLIAVSCLRAVDSITMFRRFHALDAMDVLLTLALTGVGAILIRWGKIGLNELKEQRMREVFPGKK